MGGSTGSSGNQKSTTTTTPWEPQQNYLKSIFQQAEELYKQPGPTYFPGNTVAPLSPEETQAQNMLRTNVPAVQNVADQSANALAFQLGPALSPDSNPALRQYAEGAVRPLYQGLTESVLPNIRNEAFTANLTGSNRQGIAEGIAARGTAQAAGDITSKIYSDAYGQGLENQSRAISIAPGVQSMYATAPQDLASIGAQDRAFQQAMIEEAMNRYAYNQQAPWAKLGAYQQLVTGNYGGTSIAVNPSGGVGGVSPAVGALGGAMSGAAAGAMVGGPYAPITAAVGGLIGGGLGYFGSRA